MDSSKTKHIRHDLQDHLDTGAFGPWVPRRRRENPNNPVDHVQKKMNYTAAELRGIKMNFYLINPDAEHRGILLIKNRIHSI